MNKRKFIVQLQNQLQEQLSWELRDQIRSREDYVCYWQIAWPRVQIMRWLQEELEV